MTKQEEEALIQFSETHLLIMRSIQPLMNDSQFALMRVGNMQLQSMVKDFWYNDRMAEYHRHSNIDDLVTEEFFDALK